MDGNVYQQELIPCNKYVLFDVCDLEKVEQSETPG